MYYDDWKPYVRVADRRRNAERELKKLAKKGQPVSPVVLEGKTIAGTFWGKSWCQNLEGYSDYSNRLPRGRTYVRNGSVVDLQIAAGEVTARVSGSALYKVRVKVAPVPKKRWEALCAECSGGIDSLVELLQGRFSKGVMERICRQGAGLFPTPQEIHFDCSCPDWASMCKHVAAVLYGIGARLDAKPELLFALRAVDAGELIARAGQDVPLAANAPAAGRVLEGGGDDLAALFGIELAGDEAPPAAVKPKRAAAPRKPAAKADLGKVEPAAKARPGRRIVPAAKLLKDGAPAGAQVAGTKAKVGRGGARPAPTRPLRSRG